MQEKLCLPTKTSQLLGGGEFFARVTHRVLRGVSPRDAIEEVAVLMGGFFEDKTKQAIAKYEEESNPETQTFKRAVQR
ncbi:MAG: hypothetical protein U5K55_15335 [Aliarcobacter sp.]|nr:hypothetical protein [Aliarcobacter sp.]